MNGTIPIVQEFGGVLYVSIRDECILLKEDTECDDSDIVELLRSIANNIEENGL